MSTLVFTLCWLCDEVTLKKWWSCAIDLASPRLVNWSSPERVRLRGAQHQAPAEEIREAGCIAQMMSERVDKLIEWWQVKWSCLWLDDFQKWSFEYIWLILIVIAIPWGKLIDLESLGKIIYKLWVFRMEQLVYPWLSGFLSLVSEVFFRDCHSNLELQSSNIWICLEFR